MLYWWEKLDLNQRSLAATNLQSAPFDQAQAFSHMVLPAGFEPDHFRLERAMT